MTFLGVALDPDTQKADQKLREYIRARLPISFENLDMEYSAAIQTLVNWKDNPGKPLMARITPYVYVVAEMLGANMEILGTYISRKTGSDTYHSYFVARRSDFEGNDLDGFVEYLQSSPRAAKFIFHSKFSTSSYFLPSLYFGKTGIFSVRGQSANDRDYITINALHSENASGSSDLVREVKRGNADFAAVWDGSKSKFDEDTELVFLKLPYAIPNDLLVISRSADEKLRDSLQDVIDQMSDNDINIGDFQKWVSFKKTPEARRALAMLRWTSKVQPRPVPIKISPYDSSDNPVEPRFIEAANQAIQLSGTEFVVYDEDFHKRFDVLWNIEKTHDDALIINSEFISSRLEPQQFHISFKRDDMENLVQRIGTEIAGKMHRIRYIWPFDTHVPRVLRDVNFELDPGTTVKAVKVTWNDPTNNDFSTGPPFDVEVDKTDFNSFQFREKGFPKAGNGNQFEFDPMSNSGYRVILTRADNNGKFIKILTFTIIGLFALALVFMVTGMIRNPAQKDAENG